MTQPPLDPALLELTTAEPALQDPAPSEQTTAADTTPPETLELPPRLDVKAVGALQAEILARRGHDLVLDAAKLAHLGAIGLQLIRSAARTWAEDGRSLTCDNASTDLADQMVLLGFTPETITRWESL